LSLSRSMFVSQALSLSLCLYIWLSLSPSLPFCLSLSVSLPLSLSLYLFVFLSLCLPLCLSLPSSLFLSMYLYLSVGLSLSLFLSLTHTHTFPLSPSVSACLSLSLSFSVSTVRDGTGRYGTASQPWLFDLFNIYSSTVRYRYHILKYNVRLSIKVYGFDTTMSYFISFVCYLLPCDLLLPLSVCFLSLLYGSLVQIVVCADARWLINKTDVFAIISRKESVNHMSEC
jgi:hypothetical protein